MGHSDLKLISLDRAQNTLSNEASLGFLFEGCGK